MLNSSVAPPVFPPPRTRKERVAGQYLVFPDVEWLREFYNSVAAWSQQGPGLFRGPNLASAATLTVSYPLHHVTGAVTITTISVLPTFAGGPVFLVNDGTWALATGGNIQTAYTPPAGGLVMLVFDPVSVLWYVTPSSLAIGLPVVGGTANDVLFVSGTGMLGQDANFTWDTNTLQLKKPLTMASGADLVLGSGSLVTTYDGVATVSEGIPSSLAQVNLTSQSAAIASTILYSVPAAGQGFYRVNYVAKVTTAASVSSTLGPISFTYVDPADSVTVTVPGNPVADVTSTINNATATGVISGSFTFYGKASSDIKYQVNYTSSGGTAMVFDVHVILERL